MKIIVTSSLGNSSQLLTQVLLQKGHLVTARRYPYASARGILLHQSVRLCRYDKKAGFIGTNYGGGDNLGKVKLADFARKLAASF